ncbi:MAG: Bug family tripartite tricarboxylate transporter substrate binding protein [Burkholderiales bacterium]
MIKSVITAMLGVALLAAGTTPSLAQSYPSKPVRLVVPFLAGGNTDRITRAVADSFSKTFNQQFIVDNRPGAGGAIGAEAVAKSPADGLTLLVCAVGFVITPHLQKVGYDPFKEFSPISNVASNSSVLSVHSSVPVKNLKDFIDYAKANPGKITYGSAGNGSFSHITTELFAMRAGLKLTHVPYKGGPQATADLVSGQLNSYFGNAPDVVPHSKTGRVLLLAVSSARRDKALPDLPAISESYAGFAAVGWNAMLAPTGTPRDIVDRLAAEVQKAVRDPAMISRLEQMAVDAVGSTPQELAETLRTDYKVYGEVVKAAGLSGG